MKFYDSPLFSCLLLGEQSISRSPFLIMPFFFPRVRVPHVSANSGGKAAGMACLFRGRDDFLAAHVRTQRRGNAHGAILVEIVLQERNQHAGRRHTGVVERVGEILAAVLALDADAQTTRLRVAQRGAAAHLEILLLARAPCLDVAALNFQVGQIAGAAFQRANRNIQRTEVIDGVLPEAVIHIMESSGLQTTIISCFSN